MATQEMTTRPEDEAAAQPDVGGITFRAVLLGLVFIFLFNLMVSRIELVTGRYIASGINTNYT